MGSSFRFCALELTGQIPLSLPETEVRCKQKYGWPFSPALLAPNKRRRAEEEEPAVTNEPEDQEGLLIPPKMVCYSPSQMTLYFC
jgi:hypothetical protein